MQPRSHPHPFRALALTWVGCLLVLAGCGGAPAPEAAPDDRAAVAGRFPVTVASGAPGSGDRVTLDARPTSIVSLSPTATEMLWAVGAGDQVVAVDDQSDYPAGVPTTGLSGYEPNVEAVLSYEPDLVVAAEDSGDLVAGLEAAGVPTLLLPAADDLAASYAQLERVGAATGHVARAARVVAETRDGIERAVERAPDAAGLTYFHELTPDLYTTTGDTFIGEIYGRFGLESIADRAGSGDDYPKLSAEYVVSADPDFVFLADTECCGVTVDAVTRRPGWDSVAAVENGHVVEVDEDIASRWGPRVVELAQAVAEVVAEHRAGSGGRAAG